MTLHHDPDELPRPALSTPLPRPWSRGEIAMAVAAVVFAAIGVAIVWLPYAR